MVQNLVEEREKAVALITGLTDQAAEEGRDLSEQDVVVIRGKQERIGEIDGQLDLLTRDIELADEAKKRVEALAGKINFKNAKVEYRSAGQWLTDKAKAVTGDQEARDRIAKFEKRAAAHIITSDMTGITPDPILGPVVDLIDGSRPLTQAIGPQQVNNGPVFHRPRLVDANLATGVAAQAAEKNELASQKFTIVRDDVNVGTLGGYVNVSMQEIAWGEGAMNLVISQLAKRYARATEAATVAALEASALEETYDAAANTNPAVFTRAVYAAAAQYYGATGELPTWIATDPTGWAHLGGLADAANRPAFPFLAPSNAAGTQAADSFAGNPVGLSMVVSYAITAGKFIIGGPTALEVYENRLGALQVTEPSVLGVQVAYAGFFATYSPVTGGGAVLLQP
jgi:hypothetical protein